MDGPDLRELSHEEGRVIGCLVEKEATVPDTYPMTLNGLRGACNQSSNRVPVVSYDDGTVLRALDSLKAAGLVRFVHAAHGARTTKYRHVLDERLGLDRGELAVLSVLLLRGPQTAAELRSRAERQHEFASVGEVEGLLQRLAEREPPLVRLLPREPGRREQRWAQLVTLPDPVAPTVLHRPDVTHQVPPAPAEPDEVERLRAELADLRQRFEELCRRLGETDL